MNLITKLFDLSNEDLKQYKVHFAYADGKENPLNAFIQHKFKAWQEEQSQNNFTRKYILSLISIDESAWLFAGIYEVISCERQGRRYKYETVLTENNSDLIGRLVVRYNKKYRFPYTYLENNIKDFQISEILKNHYSNLLFPGYSNICLSYPLLNMIILQKDPSWYTALKNVKGVYLIVNTANGKKYVGAAYGDLAFWSRWKQYALNGHGENVALKEELGKDGEKWTGSLVFTILEIMPMKTMDQEVIDRENYWKEILMTRKYGYNKN